MSRAFIVLARNDIHDNLLQALDLQPNTSLRLPSYSAPGQTSYLSHFVQNDSVTFYDIGADTMASTATVYGLIPYLLDVIDVDGAVLDPSDAAAVAGDIFSRVDSGLVLTASVLNTLVNDAVGGSTEFDGTAPGSDSTGTVLEVLRILSGEVYRVREGVALSGAGQVFLAARAGSFVTAPNRTRTSVTGAGGQLSGVAPLVDSSPASQDAVTGRLLNAGVTLTVPSTADLNFRDIRLIVDTPDLHRSCAQGALSVLKSSTFLFNNPSFVYGAGGTAQTVGGTAIAVTGTGAYTSRAVVVYDASGNVI